MADAWATPYAPQACAAKRLRARESKQRRHWRSAAVPNECGRRSACTLSTANAVLSLCLRVLTRAPSTASRASRRVRHSCACREKWAIAQVSLRRAHAPSTDSTACRNASERAVARERCARYEPPCTLARAAGKQHEARPSAASRRPRAERTAGSRSPRDVCGGGARARRALGVVAERAASGPPSSTRAACGGGARGLCGGGGRLGL
eukprot:scaffold191869_cov29-Tisochrysis_lutea.AAC.1